MWPDWITPVATLVGGTAAIVGGAAVFIVRVLWAIETQIFDTRENTNALFNDVVLRLQRIEIKLGLNGSGNANHNSRRKLR